MKHTTDPGLPHNFFVFEREIAELHF